MLDPGHKARALPYLYRAVSARPFPCLQRVQVVSAINILCRHDAIVPTQAVEAIMTHLLLLLLLQHKRQALSNSAFVFRASTFDRFPAFARENLVRHEWRSRKSSMRECPTCRDQGAALVICLVRLSNGRSQRRFPMKVS